MEGKIKLDPQLVLKGTSSIAGGHRTAKLYHYRSSRFLQSPISILWLSAC